VCEAGAESLLRTLITTYFSFQRSLGQREEREAPEARRTLFFVCLMAFSIARYGMNLC
jgi:hypothetical protein